MAFAVYKGPDVHQQAVIAGMLGPKRVRLRLPSAIQSSMGAQQSTTQQRGTSAQQSSNISSSPVRISRNTRRPRSWRGSPSTPSRWRPKSISGAWTSITRTRAKSTT